MTIEIITTMPLNRAQTIAGLILSILGIGWFFFLSNVIKLGAFYRMKEGGRLPIFESIVPASVMEVLKILRMSKTAPVMATCMMVTIGLMLTVFDSLIIPNTIDVDESCKTINVMTKAQISNEGAGNALWSNFEVEQMRVRRKNSGVPEDVLVGQIPDDPRWRFSPEHDVDPYPWRTSCSLYNSGTVQVRMNLSVIDGTADDVRIALPEVHEEFTFLNSPEGYEPIDVHPYYKTATFSNENDPTGVTMFAGVLMLMKESFRRGNTSEIGGKQADRLWTLRVPETTKLFSNVTVATVPIVVKAYTCEMERVKEGDRGSVALLQRYYATNGLFDSVGGLIAGNWWLAVLRNEDTSSYEMTPEYWASFLNVQGSRRLQVEDVPALISMPCIRVHNPYILLVCMYVILILIGIACWCTYLKKGFEIPAGSVEWASLACKESVKEFIVTRQATLGVISNDVKILPGMNWY